MTVRQGLISRRLGRLPAAELVCRLVVVFAILGASLSASARSKFSTEEQFHDLFVTAGYSTVFGAALGAAVIGLSPNPSGNLRYIALGASAGFIAGSVVGTYFAFAPMVITGSPQPYGTNDPLLLNDSTVGKKTDPKLVLKPVWNHSQRKLAFVGAEWTLWRF